MDFDPYESWLGIPRNHRSPTCYELLGLAPFESDPVVIDQATRQQVARLRPHQAGPHSGRLREVVAALAGARLLLLDSARRAEYDATLRAEGRYEAPAGAGRPDRSVPDALRTIVTEEVGGAVRLRPADSTAPAPLRGWITAGALLSAALGAWLYVHTPSAAKPAPVIVARNDAPRPAPKPRPKFTPQARTRDPMPVVPARPQPAAPPPDRDNAEPADSHAQRTAPSKKPPRPVEAAPDAVLTDRGLKRDGALYLLAEAEEAVLGQIKVAADFHERLNGARVEIAAIAANDANLEVWEGRMTVLNADIGELDREIGSFGRNNAFPKIAMQLRQEQLVIERAQLDPTLQAARRARPSPQRRREVRDDFERRRTSFLEQARYATLAAEKLQAQYGELARDGAVAGALRALRDRAKARVELGPSPRFKNRYLELRDAAQGAKTAEELMQDYHNQRQASEPRSEKAKRR